MDAREAELLAAIAAAPDDDAPRLVYADWCQQDGDRERGEYIALLLAGEDQRAAEILERNRARWCDELGVREVGFERGLPTSLRIPYGGTFSFDAPRLAHMPIRAVRCLIRREDETALAAMLAWPFLERLERLDVTGSDCDPNGWLAVVRRARRLVELGARDVGMGPEQLRELVRRPWRVLTMSHNRRLGDEGAMILAAAARQTTLVALDVRFCEISPGGARLLRESPCLASVRELLI